MITERQETTTWQEAVPQNPISHYIHAEQPTAERTLAHLYDERIVLPIHTIGEVPGYHPHHSKSKSLHTAEQSNRRSTQAIFISNLAHHSTPIHHHVIDYYIYTLEHILI